MAHEQSVTSTASTARVWELWSNPATWPDWNPDVRAISLDGPFQNGATGSMTTTRGTHHIRLENIEPGRSFELVAKPMPATHFHFHCEVTPDNGGSCISQSVRTSGLFAFMGAMMGKRIAEGFVPILQSLARAAEGAPAEAPA